MQRHRHMLVLSGNRVWAMQSATYLLQVLAPAEVHWFSDRAPDHASSSRVGAAMRVLGRELDALVFDAFSGFDPDAFGVLSGAIRGGGLLMLLIPELEQWPGFNDPQNQRITVAPVAAEHVTGRFLLRLQRVIQDDPDVYLYQQGKPLDLPLSVARPCPEEEASTYPYRTQDQQHAVEAVCKVVTGHRRRPVVLISDRGRGKSAAFGLAAARLMQDRCRKILLTGPRVASVEAVFDHAQRLLPKAERSGAALSTPSAVLQFVAPDELVHTLPDADLLLVDEAAAIPAPILTSMLKQYSRIAFATTVHGYEGTGRGFAVRFNRMLDKYSNCWQSLHMSTPIRWAADDPLERLVFRMLLLDANAAPDSSFKDYPSGEIELERLDRDRLCADESTLSELFGLLVLAHYRTRPMDLRHLLDGPNLSIYVLRVDRHVGATVLVAEEGGFDAKTARSIWAGRTRPHGHLLPETLAAHQGLMQAPQLRSSRVMRIAVHPALQGRGIGTRLVEHITLQAQRNGSDYVGSSFGATPELLRFWHRLGWRCARLSIQRGASSGSHSVVVLKALTEEGEKLCDLARRRFTVNFPHQLSDSLCDLETELVEDLMRDTEGSGLTLDEADWNDLRALAFEQRLLEVCIGPVWKLACIACSDPQALQVLDGQQRTVLIVRVLQKHTWQEAAQRIGVPGKAQALGVLRGAVAELLGYFQPS